MKCQKDIRVRAKVIAVFVSPQRKQYLAQAKLWGWKLLKERREKGWLGFLFSSG